jgi:hypothetical protein
VTNEIHTRAIQRFAVFTPATLPSAMLAQAITLLTSVWELPGSNPGRYTFQPKAFLVCLSASRKYWNSTLTKVTLQLRFKSFGLAQSSATAQSRVIESVVK